MAHFHLAETGFHLAEINKIGSHTHLYKQLADTPLEASSGTLNVFVC